MPCSIATRRPALVALLALAAAAGLRPAVARPPPTGSTETEAPAERFGEAIDITEIEVPVQRLRNGEPVRGMTQ